MSKSTNFSTVSLFLLQVARFYTFKYFHANLQYLYEPGTKKYTDSLSVEYLENIPESCVVVG
jgi:hypothetical protein